VSVDGFAIDRHQWWAWVPNANWRRPFGPGSDIAGKTDPDHTEPIHLVNQRRRMR
jgi:hypothetical protein